MSHLYYSSEELLPLKKEVTHEEEIVLLKSQVASLLSSFQSVTQQMTEMEGKNEVLTKRVQELEILLISNLQIKRSDILLNNRKNLEPTNLGSTEKTPVGNITPSVEPERIRSFHRTWETKNTHNVPTPSLFHTPTLVSDMLAIFLGEDKGCMLTPSDVTTRICNYAQEYNLMKDMVTINADAPLRELLGLKESDQIRILNLQRYLTPHYKKPSVTK
jgi:hypothetical protein